MGPLCSMGMALESIILARVENDTALSLGGGVGDVHAGLMLTGR